MLFPHRSGSDDRILTRIAGMFITCTCQWLFSQMGMNNSMINVELLGSMLIDTSHSLNIIGWI